jgi:hypothetical protein
MTRMWKWNDIMNYVHAMVAASVYRRSRAVRREKRTYSTGYWYRGFAMKSIGLVADSGNTRIRENARVGVWRSRKRPAGLWAHSQWVGYFGNTRYICEDACVRVWRIRECPVMATSIFVSEDWSRERSAGLREHSQWSAHHGSGEPSLLSIVENCPSLYPGEPPFLAAVIEIFGGSLPPLNMTRRRCATDSYKCLLLSLSACTSGRMVGPDGNNTITIRTYRYSIIIFTYKYIYMHILGWSENSPLDFAHSFLSKIRKNFLINSINII